MAAGASTSFLRWREIPRGIWALGFVSLFMDLSSEMIHALLPLHLVTTFGASTLAVGAIEGAAEAIASLVKVFSGAASDRLRKRKLLVAAGYGLAALSKPIFPLAGSVTWLAAARFLDRVGKGIRGAPRDALVADLAPIGLRGASYGLRQSLDTIGAFLGPLAALALMIVFTNDFRAVFWVAAVPAFLSFALVVLAVREPERPLQPSLRTSAFSRAELAGLGRPCWTVIGFAGVFSLARFSEAFLLFRAQSAGLELALVPAVMVVMNLAYAVAAWPAGVLSDRIGRTGLLAAGLALLVGADLVLAFTTSLVAVGVGVTLWGFHMGLTQGLLASLVADCAPPARRGTAFGMFHLVTGIAALLASTVAGARWASAGPSGTFLAGAAFASLALLALPMVSGKPRDADRARVRTD